MQSTEGVPPGPADGLSHCRNSSGVGSSGVPATQSKAETTKRITPRLLDTSTRLFRILSWAEVNVTTYFFLLGFAPWVAHDLLHYTLVGIAVNLALLSFLVSLVLYLCKVLHVGPDLPQPSIPLDPEKIRQLAGKMGDWVVSGVELFNRLHTWQVLHHSLKALGYTFLLLQSLPLCTPGYFLTLWVAAFVCAPLYAHFGHPLDDAIESTIIPTSKTLTVIVNAQIAAFKESGSLGVLAGGVTVVLVVYYLWDKLSFVQALTTLCLSIGGIDAIEAIGRMRSSSGDVKAD